MKSPRRRPRTLAGGARLLARGCHDGVLAEEIARTAGVAEGPSLRGARPAGTPVPAASGQP